LNIKFRENAKFLETIPIRVIVMALNVEGRNGRKKRRRKNIFKDRPLEGKKKNRGERMTPLLIN
jgi:hypothetical protein